MVFLKLLSLCCAFWLLGARDAPVLADFGIRHRLEPEHERLLVHLGREERAVVGDLNHHTERGD